MLAYSRAEEEPIIFFEFWADARKRKRKEKNVKFAKRGLLATKSEVALSENVPAPASLAGLGTSSENARGLG